MIECLVGIGLKGPEITRIAQLGTPYSILAPFGRGAVACVFMKQCACLDAGVHEILKRTCGKSRSGSQLTRWHRNASWRLKQ